MPTDEQAKCECSLSKSKVIDTRFAKAGKYRRRECLSCGKRFSTIEAVAPQGRDSLILAKKALSSRLAADPENELAAAGVVLADLALDLRAALD